MFENVLSKIKESVESFLTDNQILAVAIILVLFIFKLLNVNDEKIKNLINKKGK